MSNAMQPRLCIYERRGEWGVWGRPTTNNTYFIRLRTTADVTELGCYLCNKLERSQRACARRASRRLFVMVERHHNRSFHVRCSTSYQPTSACDQKRRVLLFHFLTTVHTATPVACKCSLRPHRPMCRGASRLDGHLVPTALPPRHQHRRVHWRSRVMRLPNPGCTVHICGNPEQIV